MCHELLQDPCFFRFLSHIDAELAAERRAGGCLQCSGPLHVANFPRKPRGCPASVREEYSKRLSFTCGRCDSRSTPRSVRFFGRRMYVAVLLMLVSPSAGRSACDLAAELQVPVRTLTRWRRWWREDFVLTPFWQAARTRLNEVAATEILPGALLERFGAPLWRDRLLQLLRFVSPLSARTMIA